MQVNVYAAKSQLSHLIRRAAEGEDVVITRNGEPVARLVPIGQRGKQRKLGRLHGKIRLGDDFDAPLPDAALAACAGQA